MRVGRAMTHPDQRPPRDSDPLLLRAAGGEAGALAEILAAHRTRLQRMVEARLDRRLRARVAASDVLQDVSLEVAERLPAFLEARPMPLFLWLRLLTAQRLGKLRRTHLGSQRRDVRREAPEAEEFLASSSDRLARHLAAHGPTPSSVAAQREQAHRLEIALEQLDSSDREIISLRNFEQLTNVEVARELGIETSAASKRYLRALKRLRELIGKPDDASDRRG